MNLINLNKINNINTINKKVFFLILDMNNNIWITLGIMSE